MPRALHAELQKAHRRHDLAVCLLVPLVILVWVGYSAPEVDSSTIHPFSALFYMGPTIDAILMPIGMAVLARPVPFYNMADHGQQLQVEIISRILPVSETLRSSRRIGTGSGGSFCSISVSWREKCW